MSLFDKIFGNQKKVKEATHYFKALTAYQPTYKTFNGMLYESGLVRGAIDAVARHTAKLEIKMEGSARPVLRTRLLSLHKPNNYQTWSQFLYRTATILMMQNTCFIIPLLDKYGEIIGYWSALPTSCEIVEDKMGREWLRYHFTSGDIGAVEMERCGIVTRHQYSNDFFGDSNKAMHPTIELLDIQRQSIKHAAKSAGAFRFMARLTNFKDPEDMLQEQKNFTENNLSADASGFLLFPNTYDSIQQIRADAFSVDTEQVALIQNNVFDYYGVNENIMQNKATSDELDAFYDGAIEPIEIQLSEVLTNMTFTDAELGYGNKVLFAANRLQYMKTSDKIQFVSALGDRGFLTINEARELLNYPPLPENGDKLPIRGEYYFVGEDGTTKPKEEPADTPKEDNEDGSEAE